MIVLLVFAVGTISAFDDFAWFCHELYDDAGGSCRIIRIVFPILVPGDVLVLDG